MSDKNAGTLQSVIHLFAIYGDLEGFGAFGSGHINSTYRSAWNQAGVKVRYLHQKINEKVFSRPNEVMENIVLVTNHVRGVLEKDGADNSLPRDASRGVLTVVPSVDGKPYVRDGEGGWWRTYLFIEGTHSLELAASPNDARFLGKSIARFHDQLSGLGGACLYETIKDFHDMEKRYARFYDALFKDSRGRVKDVRPEITFLRDNEERGALLIRALESGAIPERVCHNDAKINNILVDNESARAVCVVDLDTVMPGTPLFDFGDLVRTVTTRAAEDERDLSKVEFDPVYFEALLSGYLSRARGFLVPEELALLAEAGRNITQIMALRFLTDYLEGDRYYRTARPEHNLDRCRAQIALVKSMDTKRDAAAGIVSALLDETQSGD